MSITWNMGDSESWDKHCADTNCFLGFCFLLGEKRRIQSKVYQESAELYKTKKKTKQNLAQIVMNLKH